MRACWDADPAARPVFAMIVSQLLDMRRVGQAADEDALSET